jgi:hypothetical protein
MIQRAETFTLGSFIPEISAQIDGSKEEIYILDIGGRRLEEFNQLLSTDTKQYEHIYTNAVFCVIKVHLDAYYYECN